MYYKLKPYRKGTEKPDGSVIFYVISAKWIEMWKQFINKKQPMPNPIDNTDLKNFIQMRRKTLQYPECDEDLGVKKYEDYYEFDYRMWKFFFDLYGCNCPIQIKYFSKKLLRSNQYNIGSTSVKEDLPVDYRSILNSE